MASPAPALSDSVAPAMESVEGPPCPEEGVVSWNCNTTCNYRCSYCTQRFMDDRGRYSRDAPRFLAAFARLPGRWEIKISGGEPLVHPRLEELVGGLAALQHRVSLVTNLSASPDRLLRVVAAARGRLGVFSCSLHLEYVESDAELAAFIDKARAVQGALLAAADPTLPAPSLCVTSVATRAALPRLTALAERFAQAALVFKIQPEKQGDGVIDYDPAERAVLVQLGGHNRTGRLQHDLRGRPCWAGARYLILDDRGRAYRCYPAKRARGEFLGDFLSPDFKLAAGPAPCRYAYCNCTVPIERRMMRLEDAT